MIREKKRASSSKFLAPERDLPGPLTMFTTRIFGIVNITRDSFSDGGRYLQADAALRHAHELHRNGAHVLDLGAASSHPDSEKVSAAEEINRLAPVLDSLMAPENYPDQNEEEAPLSVDSYQPEVQRYAIKRGVAFLNDIQGFPYPEVYPDLAAYTSEGGRLILMHSIQREGAATRADKSTENLMGEIQEFFKNRIEALSGAGVPRDSIILDPGMGFFLGARPENSLEVLKNIGELKRRFELEILVSVSRKSFLGELTGRPTEERGAATLAAELFAVSRGADYIRTHDVAALSDALKIQDALQ